MRNHTTTPANEQPVRPYGSWPSPITSDLLTRKSVRLGEPQITATGSYWLESRPQELGRNVLMFQPFDGDAREVLPGHISVRTKAHEYGGGSYLATERGVFYVNASDQRVYQSDGLQEIALTPATGFTYADFCLDAQRNRLICVREDHRSQAVNDSKKEPANELVAIGLPRPPAADTSLDVDHNVTVLVSGHDFFSNPELSPDGTQLSWLCWDHPHMPWDASECWISTLNAQGLPEQSRRVAGGTGESIFQPQWSPDGQLYLVSDRSNWWNIYQVDDDTLTPVTQLEAEFATPQWVFGMSTYGFLNDDEILACCTRTGQWQLVHIDTRTGHCQPLATDCTDISQIQSLNQRSVFLAANPNRSSQLMLLEGNNVESLQCLAQSGGTLIDPGFISQPQAVTFATGSPVDGQQPVAHGFYYPPCNADVTPPPDTAPPLIVLCHGGPTGATETGLNLKIQYWTSRGFAVMDVNYRGSTGYGRHYREQLHGAWGIHDVEDVCAAARYLTGHGLANPQQLAIKGSSAGGYTVLAALTFTDTFKAGASLYGIGDLETLATDTHKFESRYLDSLIGPYPEARAVYHQRSPIHHTERLNCPVIFFQGLDDLVVPPAQAQAMVDALDQKQVPVAYVTFASEAHGFRMASSIQRCLEAEWSFYGQVFGFAVPDTLEPVRVKNLHPASDHSAEERS